MSDVGPVLLGVGAVGFGALLLLVLIGRLSDIEVSFLTRDPAAELDAAVYVGAVSNIGIVLWAATAAVCLFAIYVVMFRSSIRESDYVVLLVAVGFFACSLGFDVVVEEDLSVDLSAPKR